jgi:hypothetical protein
MEEQEQQQTAGQNEPEFLYHYTTEKGLYGILESDCIWATHYLFLNDGTERQLGLSVYRETLAGTLIQRFSSSPDCGKAWVDYLQSYFNSVAAFVLSFSIGQPDKSGPAYDRLSMWRGYSSGEQGYCLVFDGPTLFRWSKITGNRNSFGHTKCYYLDEESESTRSDNINYRDRVAEMITEDTFDLFNNKISNSDILQAKSLNSLRESLNSDPCSQEAIWSYITGSLCLCIALKHSGFSEESEYRLINFFYNGVSAPEQIQFRAGKSGQIPYIEIPLGLRAESSPLKGIICGPSPNNEQVAAYSRIRLQQMDLPHVKVIASEIPYRG